MALVRQSLSSGVTLQVRIEDFTPPWRTAPVALLLHGTMETSEAYRLWTPWLARHFRVVAPDFRGMGGSGGVTADSRIEMRDLVDDAHALMQALGAPRYFVVGEKLGALAALSLAAAHPQEVAAVSVAAGMISPSKVLGGWIPEWKRLVREEGMRAWVDATQGGRMGDELEPAAMEWWSDLMARSVTLDTAIPYLDFLSRVEVSDETLAQIQCPVQFLAPAHAQPSDGTFDQRRPRSEADAWRSRVKNHVVTEIDSASYHIAATRPDECAQAARDFFLSVAD